MRTGATLILIVLFSVAGCQQIRDDDAVVVITPDVPPASPTSAPQESTPARNPAASQSTGQPQHATQGAPAHAPAQGVRRKRHDGMELELDTGLGVYIVVNHKQAYFHKDLFLRFYQGAWIVAARFDGPWREAKKSQVPDSLRRSRHAPRDNAQGRL